MTYDRCNPPPAVAAVEVERDAKVEASYGSLSSEDQQTFDDWKEGTFDGPSSEIDAKITNIAARL